MNLNIKSMPLNFETVRTTFSLDFVKRKVINASYSDAIFIDFSFVIRKIKPQLKKLKFLILIVFY